MHAGLSEARLAHMQSCRKCCVPAPRIGYNVDAMQNIMRQNAYLVFNPIKINNCAAIFNPYMPGVGEYFRLPMTVFRKGNCRRYPNYEHVTTFGFLF